MHHPLIFRKVQRTENLWLTPLEEWYPKEVETFRHIQLEIDILTASKNAITAQPPLSSGRILPPDEHGNHRMIPKWLDLQPEIVNAITDLDFWDCICWHGSNRHDKWFPPYACNARGSNCGMFMGEDYEHLMSSLNRQLEWHKKQLEAYLALLPKATCEYREIQQPPTLLEIAQNKLGEMDLTLNEFLRPNQRWNITLGKMLALQHRCESDIVQHMLDITGTYTRREFEPPCEFSDFEGDSDSGMSECWCHYYDFSEDSEAEFQTYIAHSRNCSEVSSEELRSRYRQRLRHLHGN